MGQERVSLPAVTAHQGSVQRAHTRVGSGGGGAQEEEEIEREIRPANGFEFTALKRTREMSVKSHRTNITRTRGVESRGLRRADRSPPRTRPPP